ncbi:MAG: hypothetical protein II555_04145 [Bacteroidales bacterium]|nr:hypothetical protein [Bacteroidales bacterium]
MRHIPKILCLATMMLFLLPVVQKVKPFVEVQPLKGVYVHTEKPQLTFSSFVKGEWQKNADRYVKEHFGFHEHFIRLYNQCFWTIWHRPADPSPVLVGKDDYLFEPSFVNEYYTGCFNEFYPDSIPLCERPQIFRRRMSRLAKLQAILEEQGTHLFLALLPGKERIYPQYLPNPRPRTGNHTSGTQPRAYDLYRNSRYDFRRIDLCHCFDSLNGHTPYLLFTKTGTHWSNIASTYAFDSVMRYMQTFGPPIHPVTLGTPYYAPTREPDNDLYHLLNIMTPVPADSNLYVDVTLTGTAPGRNPSLVVIGDSFFWNILYNFPIQELFSDFRYWYYFSTIYYDPTHDKVADIDLVDELLRTDYVMLSYCTVQLYDCGNGFINRALLELCYDPDEIQAVRDSIAADTTSTLTIDQRIDQNLEQYFPAIAEPLPTKRCTKIAQQK